MENISKVIRELVKNNSSTKIVTSCGIGSAMSLAVSKSIGIEGHMKNVQLKKKIFQDILENLLRGSFQDFLHRVEVRNEDLEDNENGKESYAYIEVKDIGLLIKVIVTCKPEGFTNLMAFEFRMLSDPDIMFGKLDSELQEQIFIEDPIEKKAHDRLWYYTSCYYDI